MPSNIPQPQGIFDAASLPTGIMIPEPKSTPQSQQKAIYIPLAEAEDYVLPSPTTSLPSLSSSPLSSSGSSFLLSPTSRTSPLPDSAILSDDSSFEDGDAFSDAAPSSFMNSPAFEPVRSDSRIPTFDDVFVAPAPPQSERIYSKFELLKLGEDFKSAITPSPSRRANDHYSSIHDQIGKQLAKDAPWVYIGNASASGSGSSKKAKTKKSGNTTAKKGNSNNSKKGKKADAAATEKPVAVPSKLAPLTSSNTALSPASTTLPPPPSNAAHAHHIRGPALPPSTGDAKKKQSSQFTRISGRADESNWWKRREMAA